MGKFLRVMVVFLFVLAIAALVLGSMLFAKREILKGRTSKFEKTTLALARTLEAEEPQPPEDPPSFPAKDISDCTDEILAEPVESDFWKTYKIELESLDQNIIDLSSRTRDLMSYYKVDPVTHKAERDPITNAKITDGPGTTQGVLDEVLKKAEAQYDRLTATRQALMTLRIELVETVTELNSRKLTLREKLNKIVELNAEIMRLNGTISSLRDDIDDLNSQVSDLEGRITDLEAEKRVLIEEKENLELKNVKLGDIVQELRGEIERLQQIANPGGDGPVFAAGDGAIMRTESLKITPGVAGSVVSVDEKYGFVVLRLSPEFLDELVNTRTDDRFPLVELIIKRGDETFVSKVRLSSLRQDRMLAIGDVMKSWQQMPIQVGDDVIFQ